MTCPPALAARPCLYDGCAEPARLYVSGWRCALHGPPTPPVPPVGTTAVELAEQAHVRHLEQAAAAKVTAATRAAEIRARRALHRRG